MYFLSPGCQVYSCPPVSPDTAGICSEECSNDDDCDAAMMCCSNGCGHVCTHPAVTPYHAPPYDCPVPDDDTAGACVEDCGSEGECPNGQQCCSNGCGHTCQGVCHLIQAKLSNQTLIGAFIPECEDDGGFSAIQCHGSTGYCWCVDTQTGSPLSEQARGEVQCSEFQLNVVCTMVCTHSLSCMCYQEMGFTVKCLTTSVCVCSKQLSLSLGCSYNGETHTVGEVFRHIDGFNTW